MERLHPGIKKMWIIGSILPSIIGGAILFFFGFFIYTAIFHAGGTTSVVGLIPYLIVFIIILYIWTIFYNYIAFNRYLFEIRDDGIYIESGVIGKKYNLIPYSKIQNIDIRRGVYARMFGYSELFIQTAGYSGGRGGPALTAEGVIPAVDPTRAEQIRDTAIKRSKK